MRSRLLPVAVLALAVPVLAGCQAFGINERYDALYPDLETAEESWDAAKLPMLVPDDARSIRIGYNTIDEGQVMRFTSQGGLTADYCEEGEVAGAPAFEPGWWPDGDLPEDGWVCGDWNVVADGDDAYLVWD
jgi:hypothetical protein